MRITVVNNTSHTVEYTY